jgi:hypothetical protein
MSVTQFLELVWRCGAHTLTLRRQLLCTSAGTCPALRSSEDQKGAMLTNLYAFTVNAYFTILSDHFAFSILLFASKGEFPFENQISGHII